MISGGGACHVAFRGDLSKMTKKSLAVNDEEINFRSTWFIGVQISQSV